MNAPAASRLTGLGPAVLFFFVLIAIYALILKGHLSRAARYPAHRIFAQAAARGELSLPEEQRMFESVIRNGRAYNPQAPLPVLLMAPLMYIAPDFKRDHLFGAFVAAIGGTIFYLALARFARRGRITHRAALFAAATLCLGSMYLVYAVNGFFWFLNHLCAVAFICLSLYFWLAGDGRPRDAFRTGLMLGIAGLARYNAFVLGAGYLYSWVTAPDRSPSERLRSCLFGCAGLGVGVALVLLFNYLRFGSAFDFGYSQFNGGRYIYLPNAVRHFYESFIQLPSFSLNAPYIILPGSGQSVFIFAPALLFLFGCSYADRRCRALLIGIGIYVAQVLLYSTNGAWQVGYRYLLEALPFAFAILALNFDQMSPRRRRALYLCSALGFATSALATTCFYRWPNFLTYFHFKMDAW